MVEEDNGSSSFAALRRLTADVKPYLQSSRLGKIGRCLRTPRQPYLA